MANISGPGIFQSINNIWQFFFRPMSFMNDMKTKYGDFVRIWMGPKLFFFVFHPKYVQHILQAQQKNYLHSRLIFNKLIPLTGAKGLVQLEGQIWKRHRKMTNTSFKAKQLENFVPFIVEIAEENLKSIKPEEDFDISELMTVLVLQTAAKIIFGSDEKEKTDMLSKAFLKANRCCGNRIKSILHLPNWIPSPNNLRFASAMKDLNQFAYEIITQRRQSSQNYSDMLATLMEVTDETTGEKMDDRQLRDHTMTFLFAGHETTACSLAWCFYLIAKHPQIEKKLLEEIQQVLDGRLPTHKDLMQFKYASMVYQEALRLYPPAWIMARNPVAQDEIEGVKIPKNCNILLSVWEVHRHPEFWENPNEFIPERFSPENSKKRHKFAFFPFGAGPRICSGTNLALMEGVLILAVFLQRYKFSLIPDQKIEIETTITARPRYGIYMKASKIE